MEKPYRVKPWWLRWTTTTDVWVTIYPYIYVPVGLDPASRPEVCVHENVHLGRQGVLGKWTWLWMYLTSKSFRLREEVLGIVAEILYLPSQLREDVIQRYAYQLASSMYRGASPDVATADAAIRAELGLHTGVV